MKVSMGSLLRVTIPTILLLLSLSCSTFTTSEIYDALDPDGNISIKWDVMNWTADGYVAVVRMFNFYWYRQIPAPGWSLEWTWSKNSLNEVIWSMRRGRATEQGDCSRFKNGSIPHSCEKRPTIVDLLPETSDDRKSDNCCKGGMLSSWLQDSSTALSSFELVVGSAGTSFHTVKVPKRFTLHVPTSLAYTCGPSKVVRRSTFLSPDGKNATQAKMTWEVVCRYSKFLAPKTPK